MTAGKALGVLMLAGMVLSSPSAARTGADQPPEEVVGEQPPADAPTPGSPIENETRPTADAEDGEAGVPIGGASSGSQYRIPDPCQPWEGGRLRPWDRTHHLISRTLCWPSQWFDGFFADPDDDIYSAGTWVQVTGTRRWRDNDQHTTDVAVDASAELPHAQRKLRLVFSNDEEREAGGDSDVDTEAQDPQTGDDPGGFRTALRLAVRTTKKMNLDADLGIRSEFRTFFRTRGRWQRELGAGWYGRLEERVFWEDPDGWGSTTTLDFDRPLGPLLNLRFSTEAELTEENNELNRDWFLSQNATLFWKYSKHAAVSFNVGANGYTDPVAAVETWYTNIRLRRNVWRPWLFFEVQPFAYWPRSDDYHGVTGIALRLETLFGLY